MQRVKGIELDLIHPMSNQPSNLISTPTRDSICILPVLRMHAFLCWQMLFYYGQNIQILSKNYHSMDYTIRRLKATGTFHEDCG
jgi:hypothetical protein